MEKQKDSAVATRRLLNLAESIFPNASGSILGSRQVRLLKIEHVLTQRHLARPSLFERKYDY